MPRVITPGPGESEQRCTCKGCGAVVGYVNNDIKEYHGRDISGGPDGHAWVVCPQCSRQIILRSW